MADKGLDLRRLLWVVLAEILLYVVLDAIAQSLPPHYNPISQAESDLAVGPYGYIMALNFVNRGVLSLIFVYVLAKTLPAQGQATAGRYRTGLSLLAVWGVGALLLAIFPTDVPATPVSWHGLIHLVVATIAFLAGAVGALSLSGQFARDDALRGLAKIATPIAILAVVFCLVTLGFGFVAPHFASRIGGLDERLFLGLELLWIAAASLYLLRHTVKTRQ
jgi:hypothetical membrane protein